MQHKINTAAITLFEQYGQDFTLDQLIQKAETSRATLYRRIGSKDELLKSLAKQNLINLNAQSDIKTRILSATRKIVTQHGFINCTMDQIATEAGLGIATLYRHFSEKENLLLAYVNARKADFDIEFELKQHTNFEDGLLAVVITTLSFIDKNDDLVKMMFFGSPDERKYIRALRHSSSKRKSTLSLISEFLNTCQQNGEIQTHISIEDLTTSLIGQILHFAITAPTHFARPLNIENDAKTITNIFSNGLKNPNSTA